MLVFICNAKIKVGNIIIKLQYLYYYGNGNQNYVILVKFFKPYAYII